MIARIRSLVQGHSGRVTVGAAAGLAVAVLAAVVALLVVVAGPSGTTSATHVDPTPMNGNPDCSRTFGLVELIKIENGIQSGTFGAITLTVPSKLNSAGTFDWTSTISIGLVIVKAGNSANIYEYIGGSFGDQQLHGQFNPKSGQFAGLSHISFCDPGTPDTPTPTPTNTPPTVTPPDECPTATPDPKGGGRDPCESEKPTPDATPTPKDGGGR